MSILGRKISLKAVVVAVALMMVAALLPVMTKAPDREIVLVARGMAFYLEGDPSTPNPTLQLYRGESVRIVLRNDDRGMTHDLAFPRFGAATGLIDWSEQDDVTIDVPDVPGTYEYVCRPHQLMMQGRIVVSDQAPPSSQPGD